MRSGRSGRTAACVSECRRAALWRVEPEVRTTVGLHERFAVQPTRRNPQRRALRCTRASCAAHRTYGARRVWRDVLEQGQPCGLHHRAAHAGAGASCPSQAPGLAQGPWRALRGRRQHAGPPVPDRCTEPEKWEADFTYIWTAEGWLYVAAVLDLYSRRIVGWSMQESRPSLRRILRSGWAFLAPLFAELLFTSPILSTINRAQSRQRSIYRTCT